VTRRREDVVLTAIFMVVAAVAALMSAGLSPVARRAPLVVAVPTLVLLAMELGSQFSTARAGRRLRRLQAPGIGSYIVKEKPKEGTPHPDERTERRRELAFLGWACVLLALSSALGMVIGLPVFVLLYLRLQSGERWPVAAGIAACAWGVLYGVLALALRINLFEGCIMRWIDRQ
jgi:hypothetical protein